MKSMTDYDNEYLSKTVEPFVGKHIASLSINGDNELLIDFDSGPSLCLYDNGQDCCEHRYMSTDDNLKYYVGSKFIGAELLDSPPINIGDNEDHHDIQFLVVKTSNGSFTMQNHNEHNGYYGGFSVKAKSVK